MPQKKKDLSEAMAGRYKRDRTMTSMCADLEAETMTVLQDYMMDNSGTDWPRLLFKWSFLVPPESTVWFANRFGNAILVFEDGSVHYLDVGRIALRRIAESRDMFSTLLKMEENARDWLMIPFVDICARAGMTLGPNRCYCFKISPIFGGTYELKNFGTISVAEYYGAMASIEAQIRDVPDGGQIELIVGKAN